MKKHQAKNNRQVKISLAKSMRSTIEKSTTDNEKTQRKSAARKKDPLSNITFRPYQPADQPWIVELTQRELGQIFLAAYQTPLTPLQVQQLIQIGQQTNIILHNNKPIGYYSFFSDDSRKRHISSLVIDKTKQRSGIGTNVMKRIEKQAKQDGIRVLEVFIQATNKPCIAFTEKLGFQYAQPPYMNTICMVKAIH